MARKQKASAVPVADALPPIIMDAVQRIPIDQMFLHPMNVRRERAADSDRISLEQSIRANGILMPIMATAGPDGSYGVVAGWRRVAAAKAVGVETAPVIVVPSDDATLARLSVVENSMRAAMHPVDQWRMIADLMSAGLSESQAAATAGVSQRDAGRMRVLASIAPVVLDAMARGDMPQMHLVRKIARAAHPQQERALKTSARKVGKQTLIDWYQMAQACHVEHISRALAFFDPAASGVVFTEDLFAEPDDDDAWTTTDVDGFMAEQEAAIAAYADKHPGVVVAPYTREGGEPRLPAGWRFLGYEWGVPDPSSTRAGRLVASLKPDGKIQWSRYAPPESADGNGRAHADDQGRRASTPRLISDAGLHMVAAIKRTAFADAVARLANDPTNPATSTALLRVLLMALDAQNVRPGAADRTGGRIDVLEDSAVDAQVHAVAVATLSDMLVFPAPKVHDHSGPIADVIARSIGAGDYLPRFDTPEFLAQCSGVLLRDVAKSLKGEGGKPPSSVAGLREFLSGKLPDWRPVEFPGREVDV